MICVHCHQREAIHAHYVFEDSNLDCVRDDLCFTCGEELIVEIANDMLQSEPEETISLGAKPLFDDPHIKELYYRRLKAWS